jgi:diguanylate cyclase (GGDEF)-like protein/PAS domain S-box-containing protein
VQNIFKRIVETAEDFIAILDPEFRVNLINSSYLETAEASADQVIGSSIFDLLGEDQDNSSIREHLNACLRGVRWSGITQHVMADRTLYVKQSYYPFLDDGQLSHIILIFHDVSGQKEMESRLTHYEFRDHVTGLFNRRSLEIILEMELEKARRSKFPERKALLFLSVNNLSTVNEVLGFETGDLLLESIGCRIKEGLRKSDYVFRFEGNQLAVLLAQFANVTDLATVAEKIGDIIMLPYHSKGRDIHLSCAIGISIYPEDSTDKDELVRHASAAMRQARKGTQYYALWDSDLHRQSVERLQIKSELTRAFQENEFAVYYQPIVDRDGVILGGEALIRWHHPEKGLVMPADFIPVLEEAGSINALTRWVLYTVSMRLMDWYPRYGIYVSVNLSARDLEDEALPDVIAGAAKDLPDPGCLKLELTESACILDVEKSLHIIEYIRETGLEILIDDFGTGESSLGYLYRIPATILKLDRLFIERVADDEDALSFLLDIIRLIKGRGKSVLIEGVDSREHYRILRKAGSDRFQGFYFSKPLPEEEFEALLSSGASLPREHY